MATHLILLLLLLLMLVLVGGGVVVVRRSGGDRSSSWNPYAVGVLTDNDNIMRAGKSIWEVLVRRINDDAAMIMVMISTMITI